MEKPPKNTALHKKNWWWTGQPGQPKPTLHDNWLKPRDFYRWQGGSAGVGDGSPTRMCGLVLPVKSPWPFWLLHELSGESICFFCVHVKTVEVFPWYFHGFTFLLTKCPQQKWVFFMVFSCFGGPASSVQFVPVSVVDFFQLYNWYRWYQRSNEKKRPLVV